MMRTTKLLCPLDYAVYWFHMLFLLFFCINFVNKICHWIYVRSKVGKTLLWILVSPTFFAFMWLDFRHKTHWINDWIDDHDHNHNHNRNHNHNQQREEQVNWKKEGF